MASVYGLVCVQYANGGVRSNPQPHLHITRVRKFGTVSSQLLLQFSSNHCGWRGNTVSATAELNELPAGHYPIVRSRVESSAFVDLGQSVSVEQLNCLAHHHADFWVCFEDAHSTP